MIVELLVGVLAGVVEGIGNLMPDMTTPGWVGTIEGQVAQVTGFMAPMGNWLPFSAASNAVQLVLVAVGVAVLVRLVRIVASFLTGGGGGAA